MQTLRTYMLMSLINIFAVAILLISSICWCRFSYVPFRKRKRVDTMDCFWICCDDADNVLSVNKINLGTRNTGSNVTWHTNKRSSGTWWCCTGEDDNVTYLFVEFVAGKGWYKRHACSACRKLAPNSSSSCRSTINSTWMCSGPDYPKTTTTPVLARCTYNNSNLCFEEYEWECFTNDFILG